MTRDHLINTNAPPHHRGGTLSAVLLNAYFFRGAVALPGVAATARGFGLPPISAAPLSLSWVSPRCRSPRLLDAVASQIDHCLMAGEPSRQAFSLDRAVLFLRHIGSYNFYNFMFSFCRFFCVVLLALGACFQAANAQKFSGIVAFGDSLSDLGNTYNYSSDFTSWLIGYDSYYYDQGRWSNGPLWVEDLDRLLGFAALQRNDGSNLYGTDFAWGGSTSADGYTSFTYYPDFYLPNLQTQIANYIKLLSTPYARMPDISQTLFTVWSGGNDVIYLVQEYSGVPKATPEGVRDHIATAITTLYNAGGRYFLVPNLPPLGDKPNYLTDPKWKMEANQFVDQYNALLQSELAELSQKLNGITIIEFHVHALFLEVLKNYTHYGLTNVTQPAFYYSYGIGTVVDNPDQYLFWDVTHPTWIGHGILGQNAYESLQAALGSLLGENGNAAAPIAGVLSYK